MENCLGLWLACQDHPSAPPSPYQAPVPAPLAPELLSTRAKAAIANEIVPI